MDPPVSEPSATATVPEATATADPPEDPPAITDSSRGFLGAPNALVSEVGARPPGAGIMPLMAESHQCDMWGKWAELMTFDTWTPPVRRFASGVAFFRGQGNGRVVAVHGLEEAQREVGEHVVDRVLPKIGQPKSTSYEGEGWAMVRHPEDRVVLHALKRMIELVKVEYA